MMLSYNACFLIFLGNVSTSFLVFLYTLIIATIKAPIAVIINVIPAI